MQALKEKGLEDNTIIIFASDHSLLMGEFGMSGKALLYDLTAKIPFFIYDPMLTDSLKGRNLKQLVSSLDIPVNILDYAGIPVPELMEGENLRPLVYQSVVDWRQELFLESLFTLRDNPFCEGIRIGDWKYIRMYDGIINYLEEDLDFSNRIPEFEQLFNLKDDPEEVNNLIVHYQDSVILNDLRQKVFSYSIEMNRKRQSYKQAITVKEKKET